MMPLRTGSIMEKKIDALKHIRRIQIKTTQEVNDIFAGAYRSVFKGKGLEFEDVRLYQPGDDERSIDWNVTARMNFPFVKNFREERELTVMLVVDVSSSLRFSSSSHLKSDLLAEIGGVLAFSAIKNNDKVGLVLFSSCIELYIPPKRGLRHVLRVIRELLFFEPKQSGTDMKTALSFIGTVHQRRTICFLMSDFLCEDFSHEASIIAKRHDLIAVGIGDPLERSFPSLGLVNIKDLESGQEQLVDTTHWHQQEALDRKQAQRLPKLKESILKMGASFIAIQTDQPYAEPLRRFFKQRRSRR